MLRHCRCLAEVFKPNLCLGNLYKTYVRLSSRHKTPIVMYSDKLRTLEILLHVHEVII